MIEVQLLENDGSQTKFEFHSIDSGKAFAGFMIAQGLAQGAIVNGEEIRLASCALGGLGANHRN